MHDIGITFTLTVDKNAPKYSKVTINVVVPQTHKFPLEIL